VQYSTVRRILRQRVTTLDTFHESFYYKVDFLCRVKVYGGSISYTFSRPANKLDPLILPTFVDFPVSNLSNDLVDAMMRISQLELMEWAIRYAQENSNIAQHKCMLMPHVNLLKLTGHINR
jgi:hypothetical protein